ncbi:uncharacterized protein EI97DRAFT_504225 [Westerdykella ornata]|uniref:Uncharacterized protein n=1 Tax=Westerdykella ornata TaxID=318751 RepID=A0A6A6J7Q7_WESOR|nr:uncharacterized protein EI97DRAFT_504225 [Westerdykella ornata]KAF2272442.1 hypothetical protein EI97DRAFT_504225 [Westerdykella ornata]
MGPEPSFKPGHGTYTSLSPFWNPSRRSRFLWTLCAGTSLLTSKYLFINAHLNYPVHIHLLQLSPLAVYTTLNYRARRRRDQTASQSSTKPSWTYLTFLAALMTLAVVSTLQAILHFPNITAFVMLSIVACLVELLLSLLGSPSSRPHDYVWLGLSLPGCCAILAGDYRLTVKGLESAIPAVLLTGTARAMYSRSAARIASKESDVRRFNMVFCCTSFVVTGLWLIFFTSTTLGMMLEVFRWKYMLVLILNVMATSTALAMGRSILLPSLPSEHRMPVINRSEPRVRDIVTIVVLTAAAGLYSSFTIRRSYTTYVQVIAFVVAILCCGGRAFKETLLVQERNAVAHAKMDNSFRFDPVDCEGGTSSDDSDWSSEIEIIMSDEKPVWYSSLRTVAIAVLVLWVLFLGINFTDTVLSFPTMARMRGEKPILDRGYHSPVTNEIVISMHKEPIADVRKLITTLRKMQGLSGARVWIYVKDEDANVDNIKTLTKANKVTILPNVGREGETYLNHILTQWDSLAQQTFFLQADVHNPREFYPRVRNYYIPGRTGMLNLGWSGNLCDCHSCADQFGFYDHTHLFPAVHAKITNSSTECSDVLLSYKGQFVVSASRIRGVPRSVYEELRDALVDPESWAHQPEFLRGQQDSMDKPAFGYVLERMWNLLFQCSKAHVAWKCPTLVSGWRIGGNVADCQCFDG